MKPSSLRCLCLFVLLSVLLSACSDSKVPDDSTTAGTVSVGVAYLQGLEKRSPAEVEKILKQERRQALEDEKEEKLQQITSDAGSVWDLFQDFALLGDSRAEDCAYYGFLPKERVFANKGDSITAAEDCLDDVVKLNPSTIFFTYGLNDVDNGHWHGSKDFIRRYRKIIRSYHDALPDADIYVGSIVPVKDFAVEESPVYKDIPDFNHAIKKMCHKEHCHFVDNDNLLTECSELYEVDGIHFTAGFYEYWAKNMIMEVCDNELDKGEASCP